MLGFFLTNIVWFSGCHWRLSGPADGTTTAHAQLQDGRVQHGRSASSSSSIVRSPAALSPRYSLKSITLNNIFLGFRNYRK